MSSLVRTLAGGIAIAAVIALMPVAGAQAQVRCSSDGWSWHCTDFRPAPPPMYQPGFYNNFYGDYNEIPNDYPGPSAVYNNR
ncbi:MAG TPA: hypothetical protein VGG57_17110 [Stellaceae bacterium]|jgi:hypothetical protein